MRTKHYAFAAASVVLFVLVLATPSLAAQGSGNVKPCLCHPMITPMTGTSKTVYVATVTYRDPDGDAPAKVEVYIDDVAYPMTRLGKLSKKAPIPAEGNYRARLTLPPGEHSYYFYTEDARGASERFPRYGTFTGLLVGQKKTLMNRLPILTDGGVYHDAGTEHSIYTFKVHYQDRDICKPPRAVMVFIDGVCHEMKLSARDNNSYYQGTCGNMKASASLFNGTYVYQTMLPAGQHAYYFMAKDGNGDCASLPAAGFIRGPEVVDVGNSRPALIDHRLEPGAGGARTRYGYLVHYNDVDYDAPSVALVYIDNVPHKMTRVKGNGANGLYSYQHGEFLSNMHTYYFYFEDAKGASYRLPDVGVFHGPVVTR
jgi:hypothetical protein